MKKKFLSRKSSGISVDYLLTAIDSEKYPHLHTQVASCKSKGEIVIVQKQRKFYRRDDKHRIPIMKPFYVVKSYSPKTKTTRILGYVEPPLNG